MLQLALYYCLFSVPSEKPVAQDLGKCSCEENIPTLLYSVLCQPLIGIVRPLTLLLLAVSYCRMMNFGFEAGWPFVPVKSSTVTTTKRDFFGVPLKLKLKIQQKSSIDKIITLKFAFMLQ